MNYEPPIFTFSEALPVWMEGAEETLNTNLIFRTVIGGGKATLRITGQMHYVVRVNGELVCEGPARCAAGWSRVDEILLDGFLTSEKNVLAIIVEGLYATGFSAVRQPSFLCAEVVKDERILAATGKSGFEAIIFSERVKKTQRYSYQRPFVEAYSFSGESERYLRDPEFSPDTVKLSVCGEKNFTLRGVPYGDYPTTDLVAVGGGSCRYDASLPVRYADRSLMLVNEFWTAYKKEELELCSSDYTDRIAFSESSGIPENPLCGSYVLFDGGRDVSGIIEVELCVEKKARIAFMFDEILIDGKINYTRMQTCNSIICDFEPGEYHFSTLEVYTLRWLQAAVTEGVASIANVRVRRVEYPDRLVKKVEFDDPELQLIFDAGRECFKQNVVDIMMDCPSRERAGWNYDSKFASMGEFFFTGDEKVTRGQLENFILAKDFPLIPAGMIPGCYPSDNDGGNPSNGYILNSSFWYVLQLEDYVNNTKDRSLVDGAREIVYGLLRYFDQFLNTDGLIERTRGWIFLDYSRANELQKDLNYPVNMMYQAAMAAAGRLYNDAELSKCAVELKKMIIARSFDGEYFVDNAVVRDGKAYPTGEHTEYCQYMAFYLGIADGESFGKLQDELILHGGRENPLDGKLAPSSIFLGKTLRMRLLADVGEYSRLKSEIKDYCLEMAKRTGTLWEFDEPIGSCCHGFNSFNAMNLARSVEN